MRQGNPFYDNTLVIHESTPRCPKSFKGLKAIEIFPNSYDVSPKPRLEGINRVLRRVPRKASIKLLGLSYNCHFDELPDFQLFPNAEYVHIGTRVKDYSRIVPLEKTKHFYLCSYPHRDLSAFKHFELESFRAIRGNVKTYDLSTQYAWLQDCGHLRRFASTTIRRLWVECCNNLDYKSLANVRGLTGLCISSNRSLQSFDFLAKLKHLKMLSVLCDSLTRTDISYLCDVGVPKMVFYAASRKLIRRIAEANPKVTVANRDILVRRGKEYTGCSRYKQGFDELTRFEV